MHTPSRLLCQALFNKIMAVFLKNPHLLLLRMIGIPFGKEQSCNESNLIAASCKPVWPMRIALGIDTVLDIHIPH